MTPASSDPPIAVGDLQGFKRVRKVAGLLAHLHSVGCDRDQAHNRLLHFDDYVLLIPLAMFNPLLDSLRTLQMVSTIEEVREVFIRFFKQILGNRHLLSTKIEGIRIQIAAGIIACMLMSLFTGVRPTKQLQVLMSLYLSGLASVAEVQREVEKERARQARATLKKAEAHRSPRHRTMPRGLLLRVGG